MELIGRNARRTDGAPPKSGEGLKRTASDVDPGARDGVEVVGIPR